MPLAVKIYEHLVNYSLERDSPLKIIGGNELRVTVSNVIFVAIGSFIP